MLNFGIFGFWGFFLGWFVFAGDAISTLSIKGTKFYDASGNQVFFKGLHSDCPKERKRLTGGNRNCVSAVAAGSIGEYHPMSTRCPINANARRKCHPMYCALVRTLGFNAQRIMSIRRKITMGVCKRFRTRGYTCSSTWILLPLKLRRRRRNGQ